MSEFRLSISQAVTLDANGNGSVTLGPQRSFESWNITRMSTSGNSATEPVLTITRNNSTEIVDYTIKGNGDISETSLGMIPGDLMTATYTGGTAGASMQFYVEGTMTRGDY